MPQELCIVRSSHYTAELCQGKREAGHVAHTGGQKIINIFVRVLSRQKKRRLKHRLRADATKIDMELYDTPGAGEDPICFPECSK